MGFGWGLGAGLCLFCLFLEFPTVCYLHICPSHLPGYYVAFFLQHTASP
jgi:hypothetical protein